MIQLDDQKTRVGEVSFVFAEEESEDGQAQKSRNVQDQRRGEEARESGSVL